MIIAIDGPSGAGKSTLGKALARRLGYLYIDSGAVYRAVASLALDRGVSPSDEAAVAGLARDAEISLEGDPDSLRVVLDGADVTERIRRPDASRASSIVAALASVRSEVVDKLRGMSKTGSVVMDGRDIGTWVFPNAEVKLFVDASLQMRVSRRWKEEHERGRQVSLDEVRTEIEERDARDRARTATPLVKADDAILLDTSDLDVASLVERALEIIKKRRLD
jgi:cytidylate kinase